MKKVTMAVSGTAMPTASATLVVQLQLGQGVGEGVGELLLLEVLGGRVVLLVGREMGEEGRGMTPLKEEESKGGGITELRLVEGGGREGEELGKGITLEIELGVEVGRLEEGGRGVDGVKVGWRDVVAAEDVEDTGTVELNGGITVLVAVGVAWVVWGAVLLGSAEEEEEEGEFGVPVGLVPGV